MPPPKVFYFCFDQLTPTGGTKQIYRHVDILNRHGIDAYVFHTNPGFRLTWFDNTTRVIDRPTCERIYNAQTDVLVLPEDLGSRILTAPGKKVVFNQNLYFGFNRLGNAPPPVYPYLHDEVVALLAVSDHNIEYLRFAYPGQRILRIQYGVDPMTFRYVPPADKKKQVACVVKNRHEVCTLMHIIESRARQRLNAFENWRWVFLEDMTQDQVAATLRDSLLFVFLSTAEGFGIAPIEAVLSGCLPIAFDCGPVPEYLPAEFRFPPHDILAVARWLEDVAAGYPGGLDRWEPSLAAARDRALQFSLEREEESVLAAWSEILGRPVH